MSFFVRQATLEDIDLVSDILCEAALWLEQQNMPLWRMDEISSTCLYPDIKVGLYYIAFRADSPAGIVKFQLEDKLFWPDIDNDDSAFIHRLAIRRQLYRWLSFNSFVKLGSGVRSKVGEVLSTIRLCSRSSKIAIALRKIWLYSPQL